MNYYVTTFSAKLKKTEEEKSELHYERWLLPQCGLSYAQRVHQNREEYAQFESYLRYLFSIGEDKMLPKGRLVYYHCKNKYRTPIEAEEQLENISCKIKFFQAYIYPTSPEIIDTFGRNISYGLANIVKIGIHSIIPFLIELLNFVAEKEFSEQAKSEAEAILKLITTLLVRQRVSRLNPKYDILFPNLFLKMKKESENKIKALKTIIGKKDFQIKDDKFKEYLISNPIYLERDRKFPYYILSSINRKMSSLNYGQNIANDAFPQIEHILPQINKEGLSPKWKEHLGEDVNEPEFENLRHTIGNLTIIGNGNGAVRDMFIDSKINHRAYGDPRPLLTGNAVDIYDKEKKWNLDTIKKRSESLADIACEIWSWG